MVVAKKAREDQADRDSVLAWRMANLLRAKRLPRLESLLISAKKRIQTVEEQRAMLEVLSKQFGGTVTRGQGRG